MPLWSPSASTAAARVHRATDGAARILGHGDTPALRRLLASDPVAHVAAGDAVSSRSTAAPGRGRQGALILGVDEGPGLAAACWLGTNIMPIGASAEHARLFGEAARSLRRRVSSIFGPAEAVLALYETTGWDNHRDIRPHQPLMAITGPSEVEPLAGVRLSRPEELRSVEKACAAMFTEELGFSPYAQGVTQYRDRIRWLIENGRSLIKVDEESGHIVFKAEFGALSDDVVQVQGVWVNPAWRGQGLAAGGMAAVVEHGLRLAPTVSLYVNDYNTPALRTYHRVGFETTGTFATILF
ncbi:GNAT family N-acetyltransferase [Nesterenkonia flava]|uniref:GNAT family N-acetyltransferase n=1 Tax=Nesterenkonia flava TaxID=469799 RepID=A0ABU1FR54_9MICC|nr:GNAT family N-acetyltransferase [Nesterenkonia flava]MDR5711121.1 GNAT family N-acetyltransferase [Nesterenkonia flava]